MSNPVRHSHAEHEHAGHPHEHAGLEHEHAGHEHAGHERQQGAVAESAPAANDNLLLDIGADTGALVIHAAADRDETEVEISPVGGGQARTHNVVRRREVLGGAVFAAVFPAVGAGDYVVWRDADTPAGSITVRGGAVATFRL